MARVPLVGVGVVLACPKGIVLLKRKGSLGAGEWSFPGGRLEFEESVISCAHREVMEEVGVFMEWCVRGDIITEDIVPGHHYITLYCYGRTSQFPRIVEPDKASDIMFVSNYDDLPRPLFMGVEKAWEHLYDTIMHPETRDF